MGEYKKKYENRCKQLLFFIKTHVCNGTYYLQTLLMHNKRLVYVKGDLR